MWKERMLGLFSYSTWFWLQRFCWALIELIYISPCYLSSLLKRVISCAQKVHRKFPTWRLKKKTWNILFWTLYQLKVKLGNKLKFLFKQIEQSLWKKIIFFTSKTSITVANLEAYWYRFRFNKFQLPKRKSKPMTNSKEVRSRLGCHYYNKHWIQKPED